MSAKMSGEVSKNSTRVDVYDGGYDGNDYGYKRVQVQQNINSNNGNTDNSNGLGFRLLPRNGIQAYGTTMDYNPTFDLDQNNFNVVGQANEAASVIINNTANNGLARSRMIQDIKKKMRASVAEVATKESSFKCQITSSPATFSTLY